MSGLVHLQAVDVTDFVHWRWTLTTEDGNELASHVVALDPASAEMKAFVDLNRHLRAQAEPDHRVESEAFLADRLGAWIGRHVLGPSVCAAILAGSPVTVRVSLPSPIAYLALAPLELANVDGAPLGRRGDVCLVF